MTSLLIRVLLTISFMFPICVFLQVPVIRILISLVSLLFISLLISWKIVHKLSFILTREVNPIGKVCLITGCDTGFGREVAVDLVKKGFTVFAGCLNPDTLRGISVNLHPVKLDVTVDEDIINVHSIITNYLIRYPNKKFWCLINNAGISNFCGIEWGWSADEMFTKLFNVNVIGSVKVSRVFIPLLKMSKRSRIVFMSSYSSRVTFPGMVPYSMTKAAIKSFADGVRREIPTIKTVIIEPSMYRTPLTTYENCWNNLNVNWAKTPVEVKAGVTNDEKEFIHTKVKQYLSTVCEKSNQVTSAVCNAVTSVNPCEYYLIYGSLYTTMLLCILKYLPDEIIDIVLTMEMKIKLVNELIAKRRETKS